MKMNTEHKHRLRTILKMDSVYEFLSVYERANIHATILGREWAQYPERIQGLLKWIEEHPAYTPPDTKVEQDKLTYVNGILKKHYVEQHKGIAVRINQLLNQRYEQTRYLA